MIAARKPGSTIDPPLNITETVSRTVSQDKTAGLEAENARLLAAAFSRDDLDNEPEFYRDPNATAMAAEPRFYRNPNAPNLADIPYYKPHYTRKIDNGTAGEVWPDQQRQLLQQRQQQQMSVLQRYPQQLHGPLEVQTSPTQGQPQSQSNSTASQVNKLNSFGQMGSLNPHFGVSQNILQMQAESISMDVQDNDMTDMTQSRSPHRQYQMRLMQQQQQMRAKGGAGLPRPMRGQPRQLNQQANTSTGSERRQSDTRRALVQDASDAQIDTAEGQPGSSSHRSLARYRSRLPIRCASQTPSIQLTRSSSRASKGTAVIESSYNQHWDNRTTAERDEASSLTAQEDASCISENSIPGVSTQLKTQSTQHTSISSGLVSLRVLTEHAIRFRQDPVGTTQVKCHTALANFTRIIPVTYSSLTGSLPRNLVFYFI
jgi:hypothetical protein